MKEIQMEQKITNELLLALLSEMYSIELLLADVYIGKANLRYSNTMLDNDKEVLDSLAEIVKENTRKEDHEN